MPECRVQFLEKKTHQKKNQSENKKKINDDDDQAVISSYRLIKTITEATITISVHIRTFR